MENPIITVDFSRYGYRDLLEAIQILTAYSEQQLPQDWEDEGVHLCFNTNSGYVFLSNSEYQVLMLNGDLLEMWYSCYNCGAEGFAEDIGFCHQKHLCSDCCKT